MPIVAAPEARSASSSPEPAPTTAHARLRARLKVLLATASATLFIVPFKKAASDGHGRGAALGLLLCVGLIFGAPALRRWLRAPVDLRRRTWSLGWRIAVAAAVGNVAQGLAFESLHPGVAAVIIQASVVFVAILGVFWLREPLSTKVLVALILTVGGILLSRADVLFAHQAPTAGDPVSGNAALAGAFWGLTAALSFAMLDLVSRRWSRGTDAMIANVQRSLLAFLLLCSVPGAVVQLLSFDLARWGACLLAAFLGPGLARGLLLSASRDLPAVETSMLQQLRVPLALPLGSVVFGIWPTGYEWAGCGLVAIGILVPLWPRRR